MSDVKVEAREIKLVDPSQLIPAPYNNNLHPKEQKDRLKKIIKRQGFRVPIEVSNRSGFIVCGHLRHECALELGMKEVPVIYQDFESEAIEYAHLTADNEIARWSELDKQAVYDAINDMPEIELDLLGINDFDLFDFDLSNEDEVDSDLNSVEKYELKVTLENEMDMHDLKDDLLTKGYSVKASK